MENLNIFLKYKPSLINVSCKNTILIKDKPDFNAPTMLPKYYLLFLGLLLLSIKQGSGQDLYTYSLPAFRQDGLPTQHLQAQKFDSTLLHLFMNQINAKSHQLHSLLVIQKAN